MAPMPENANLPNPTRDETDRDTRVRFKKSWNHAYGGVNVVRYLKDEVADVSTVCADVACDPVNAAAERVDADKVDLFDPRAAVAKKPVKK